MTDADPLPVRVHEYVADGNHDATPDEMLRKCDLPKSFLAAVYCLPPATTVFAREERVSAAFAMSEIRSVVTSRRYVGGWLRAVAIGFVAGLVLGVIGLVPILGAIAGVFVGFYVNLVIAHLFGHAVADAGGLTVPREEQPAARPIA